MSTSCFFMSGAPLLHLPIMGFLRNVILYSRSDLVFLTFLTIQRYSGTLTDFVNLMDFIYICAEK